jgi:hypothetical protein
MIIEPTTETTSFGEKKVLTHESNFWAFGYASNSLLVLKDHYSSEDDPIEGGNSAQGAKWLDENQTIEYMGFGFPVSDGWQACLDELERRNLTLEPKE